MDLTTRLRVATVGLLALVLATTTMNTCATDRLEQQVIRNTKALEKLERSGGGAGPRQVAVASRGAPGTSTGITATGWGGREAEILFVEGAAADAPLTLAQKPLPQGDTYVNRRGSPPSTLNFYTTNEGATSIVTRDILESLLIVDPDRPPEVLPALATSWEVSDDKLSVTYRLRRGVQFADGRPFTSADVLFSFAVMRDPAVKADHMRPAFEDVVELSAPDDHTVVVRFSKPYWKGLYTVGHDLRVLNRAWYEEQIPRYAEKYEVETFSTVPGEPGFGEVFNKIRVPCPGAGPYTFPEEDFDPKVPVEIVQNPFYYGIQVRPEWWNLRSQRWIYIADEVAAFEAFRKGEFDVTTLEFNAWEDEYASDPTITDIANYFEYDHMGLGSFVVVWNHREPPFDDPRVRRAMAHLLNRQWMIDELERGRGQVAVCPSKPIYPNYNTDLTPHGYDLDAARALLAEAGWTDSNGDGVLDRDGERFEFELKIGYASRFNEQWTAQFEDAAKQVGIRLSKRNLEWSTFIEDYYERRFDAVTLYFSLSDPWIDVYSTYHSSQDVPRGGNAMGWHNDQADALLEAMRAEFDAGRRDAMFKEFCSVFHDEQPLTLLIHGRVGVVQSKRFEGSRVRPTGLRSHSVWVKPENVRYE